ncbi:hypothetical protein JOE25_001212 [Serratia sp. PL17]|nr:hypothetical protein [Serratia sp. PL17]MBP1129669.1 hypothetical protein [Serratia sp. PL17]
MEIINKKPIGTLIAILKPTPAIDKKTAITPWPELTQLGVVRWFCREGK